MLGGIHFESEKYAVGACCNLFYIDCSFFLKVKIIRLVRNILYYCINNQ